MTGRIDGRVALVTGAGSGIGAATARLFSAEGAFVAVADSDRERAEEVAGELAPGRMLAVCADVADDNTVADMVRSTIEAFGRLDVLVNNAATRNVASVDRTTPQSWSRVLSVNLAGTASVCRHALTYLRKAGGASIVNVASAYALVGRPSWAEYDASKAGLIAFTRSLACEEAVHGIRVNAVCPGSTLTSWTLGRASERGMSEDELRKEGMAPSLLGRWAEPDEIAYPILWLASDEASFVTGAVLVVDGGLSAL